MVSGNPTLRFEISFQAHNAVLAIFGHHHSKITMKMWKLSELFDMVMQESDIN